MPWPCATPAAGGSGVNNGLIETSQGGTTGATGVYLFAGTLTNTGLIAGGANYRLVPRATTRGTRAGDAVYVKFTGTVDLGGTFVAGGTKAYAVELGVFSAATLALNTSANPAQRVRSSAPSGPLSSLGLFVPGWPD